MAEHRRFAGQVQVPSTVANRFAEKECRPASVRMTVVPLVPQSLISGSAGGISKIAGAESAARVTAVNRQPDEDVVLLPRFGKPPVRHRASRGLDVRPHVLGVLQRSFSKDVLFFRLVRPHPPQAFERGFGVRHPGIVIRFNDQGVGLDAIRA